MSTACMKSLGGKCLVRMFEHIEGHPAVLINGFKATGITEALQINGPVHSSILLTIMIPSLSLKILMIYAMTLIVVAPAKIYCLWILHSRIQILKMLNRTPTLSSLTRKIMEWIPKISIMHIINCNVQYAMTILYSYMV